MPLRFALSSTLLALLAVSSPAVTTANATNAVNTAHAAAISLPATAADVALIRTEKGAVATLDQSTGSPALKVELPADSGFPGVNFPLGAASLDLSAFTGVELEVSNISQTRVRLHLRVDNAGDWKNSPWNTERVLLAPNETKTIRLFFGRSQGQPAYALDSKQISGIKLFADAPKQNAAVILIKRLTAITSTPPVTTANATPATSPTTSATAASAPDVPETKSDASPAISGELLDAKTIGGIKYNNASGTVENERITAVFKADAGYPAVFFPVPKGGWDISAFAGVELTITNPGSSTVSAHLRVDNRPNARAKELGQNPWNTQKISLKAGETQTIQLTFGQNNGSPGYELFSGRVTGIQLFLIKPKQDTTLVLSNLRAWGSPSDLSVNAALTKAADRNIPVTPPEWLGQRPPVEGEWVRTLDENFDGSKLNDKIWTSGFPWDGLQPGQLQRYSAENIVIEKGSANLIAEKRRGHHNDDPARPTREYTSGLIQSYGKWTQLYGYMEARIKLPTTRGLWPAFWTMPDRGAASGLDLWKRRSTSNGAMEIDIMEHLCEWGSGRHNAALHWDDYGENHKAWGTAIFYGPTPDGWHTFGVLWEPGKLTWFIDGKKAAEWINDRAPTVPAYLKLNIQIGGWATKNVDDAKLPDRMSIDYVRAWQLKSRISPAAPSTPAATK